MADYAISAANLNYIERNLGEIGRSLEVIHDDVGTVNQNVGSVNQNVRVVYDELGQLARDFKIYVQRQEMTNRLQTAEVRLVKIRQELETKYGHYAVIRRTTTGILQANDLGIVRKETITNATEELMVSTPRYWLAPCLVALSAWINDKPELAERALAEGIRRDDQKTSLLFALICRRAGRKQACLKWTQRYLAGQDAENLDRKAVIVLDAFACGLLGADSEGLISRQMGEWLDHLSEKVGFVEQQTQQWGDAINLKRKPMDESRYTYLPKYSHTWPVLKDIMEGAELYATILEYFMDIFNKPDSPDTVKNQLDDIMNSLVTDFDEEEVPLRMQEKFEQFVVDYRGDEARAKQSMQVEKTAFDEKKDFTQLLTDAAMKPESSHASPSTQKLAIALSKDWITNAFDDVVAKNRMKIPNEIEINIDTFDDKTCDGENEEELCTRFNQLIDTEKATALAACVLSAYDKYIQYAGYGVTAIGVIMLFAGLALFGIIAIIAGVAMVLNYMSKAKRIETSRANIEAQFEQKRTSGLEILRATLAEVVDFRAEFGEKDADAQKVKDFMEQITPEQYVKHLADSTRKIHVS